MADLPRPHLLAYALVLLALVAVAFRHLGGGGESSATAAAGAPIRIDRADGGSRSTGEGAAGPRVTVHVAGAVRRPGVYRMPEGARVDDAVERAGGAMRKADLTQLNLAAKLEDGRQVLVPLRAATPAAGAAGPAGGAASAAVAAGTAPAAPVNLNTATAEQLDTLDGVGPVTVQKILQYRADHGGFSSVEELGQIAGIGDVRLGALRERVTL